jgi:membrane protein involved in colicin uptake
MSEADRNAQVEREVQQRLAAERAADEKARLDQQAADLQAREQALADKEAAAKNRSGTAAATPRPTQRAAASSSSGSSGSRASAGNSRSTPRGYDTFYRKLQPHGAWRETADYGYVWQPRQAQQSRNWRPYTEGRWAYT